MNTRYLVVLCLFLGYFACTPSEQTDPAYLASIEKWRQERIDELKTPHGWLALAGLYPLKPGANTFGSAPENGVVFPAKAPAKLGVFHWRGDSLFTEMPLELPSTDSSAENISLLWPSVYDGAFQNWQMLDWVAIRRNNQFFIRLWDTQNPNIQSLTHIDHYPVRSKWNVPAIFVPYDQPRTIRVKNVLDMEVEQVSEGVLRFSVGGKEQELTVLEGNADQYFVIFSDETSGETTYGGGRYVYVDKPDASGKSNIDFNKAYNPPCAFTEYATCLLPPAGNRLSVEILAGEKNYGEH